MRTYPRIRKTVKWGGVAVCALLLMAWVVSGWWGVRVQLSNGWFCGVGAGRVVIGWITSLNRQPVGIVTDAVTDPPLLFWWFTTWSGTGFWRTWIPLWTIAAPLAGVTAVAWRLDTLARRRARVGLCPKCHYDRAGLASGAVCPECGAAPRASAP